MEQSVLVTGASGFIGGHLVTALRSRGIRTRALIRREAAGPALLAAGADVLVGDLRDPGIARQAVAGVTEVFHLAGRLFSPGVNPGEYQSTHVDATVMLLDACRATGADIGFLLCSTTGVHGPTNGRTASEDDAPSPANAYEATKAAAERAARRMSRQYGIRLAIARPGLVFGPGDLHLLGLFRAIRRGVYRMLGSGSNRTHPIYVSDVIDGLFRAAAAADASGRSYHLVGPSPVTMREFSEAIAGAIGNRLSPRHLPVRLAYAVGAGFELLPIPRRLLPLTRSRVRFMTQDRAYDSSRAREELGFVAGTPLKDGLSRTVTWYRENRLL